MPKFFVPAEILQGGKVLLSGAHAEHLKVLRVREGEELWLSDGSGTDHRCRVEAASGGVWQLCVEETVPSAGEPRVAVTVCAGLPKGDKAETILQKAVELGAARVLFFLSSRCVSRPDGKSLKGKLARWQKIAEAAAMQSYRGRIPEVGWCGSLSELLREAGSAEVKAFLWEDARQLSLRTLLLRAGDFRSAALVTGPEGGFSPEEARMADAAGFHPVTLGRRILRCETAPLCALSALMYHTGDLD